MKAHIATVAFACLITGCATTTEPANTEPTEQTARQIEPQCKPITDDNSMCDNTGGRVSGCPAPRTTCDNGSGDGFNNNGRDLNETIRMGGPPPRQ